MTDLMDKCKVCGQDYKWHTEHDQQHTFVSVDQQGGLDQLGRKGQDKPLTTRDKPKPAIAFGFDPVLRIALLKKGIVSATDLVAAEQELRDATIRG
ncbi:MAG: hypothetical protein ACRD8U_20245 [Pyrinomonadaceae bacterium]